MELQTTRTVITSAEPLGTTVQEQGIELDYVLPTMEEQQQMQDPAGYFVFPMTEEGETLRDAKR